MILLDPDLDPDPPPPSTSVKRKAVTNASQMQLPTARTLSRFLTEAQAAVRLRGQVTILLTSDQMLRSLNRRFRGKNKATDVLSFPADATAPGAEKIAGDLAISVPAARRQAAGQGHSLLIEIKVLMLHGLLHLAGYDHEADSGQMERRERLLRGKLRLPLGLIERAGAPTRSSERIAALAAEGKRTARKAVPQGLKPESKSAVPAARLTPRPFKTRKRISSAAGKRP